MRYFYLFILSTLLFSCQSGFREDTKKDLNPLNWETDVGEDFKYGYVDTFGNVMIDHRFDRAMPFRENLAIVTPKGSQESHLINSEGTVVSEGFNYINTKHSPQFYIGDKNNKRGDKLYYLINSEGKTISNGYKRIEGGLDLGVFIVKLPCDTCGYRNTRSCILNEQGKEISYWYNDISDYTLKHFFTGERTINGKKQVVALSSKGVELSEWCTSIKMLHDQEKLYVIIKRGKDVWNSKGLMDSTGKIVLKPSYRSIKYYPLQQVIEAIKKDGADEYNSLFNTELKALTKPTKQEKYYPKNINLIGISNANKRYAFYKVKEGDLKQISSFYLMKRENKSSSRKRFFSNRRRYFSWVEYSILKFQNGFAPVIKNGKYGFINKEGKEIIKPKYTRVKSFKDGVCKVFLGSKEMIINEQGEEVVKE